MEQSVVRDVKASLSVVWGRTWPIAAAVNRTVLSTNTTVIAANSVGLENALRWGWRLSVSQIEFILTCTYSCDCVLWADMSSSDWCSVWSFTFRKWWVKCLFLQLCRVRENPLKLCPERNTSTVLPQPKRSTFARTWTVHSLPHQPLSLIQKQMPPGQCHSGQTEVKPVVFAPPRGFFLLMLFKPRVVNDLCRSSLLEQGMLVNIQQPVIQSDGTLLLATDAKVQLQMSCALGRFRLRHHTSPSFYVLCVSVL